MEQISYSSQPLLSPRSADSEVPRIIVTKPYEEQCLNRSNSLDSQQPLMVKVDQRFVQQSESLLNHADRVGENIEHVASIYLKKAGSELTRRRIPALFTIESIVFAINASELTIATICLVVIYFLRNFVSYYLNYLYYVPIIAAGVYLLAFLMVWRMKRTIRERTGVFLLVLIFMMCEAVMLCWLAPVYSEFFMLAEVSIACLSMYALTGHAMILRRAYSASTGRLIAVLFAVIGFVAYLVVFRIDQRTTVYMVLDM